MMHLNSESFFLLEVIFRIPFLFVIDAVLNNEFSFVKLSSVLPLERLSIGNFNATQNLSNISSDALSYEKYKICLLKDIGKDAFEYLDTFFNSTVKIDDCPPQSIILFFVVIIPLVSLILKAFVIALATVASLLEAKYLVTACSHFTALFTALYSYRSSCDLVHSAQESRDSLSNLGLLLHGNGQLLAGALLSRCLLEDYSRGAARALKSLLFLSLQLPLIFVCLDAPGPVLARSPILSIGLAAGLLNLRVIENAERLIDAAVGCVRKLGRQVRVFGLQEIAEQHWNRLRVPLLLRCFWFLKVAYLLATALTRPSAGDSDWLSAAHVVALGSGCENLLSLLGMTAVVSWLSQLVVLCFARYISLHDSDEWQYATVSAVLFFLLSVQTGLTSLPVADRVSRLHRNFYLMVSAMLHFVHNMCKVVMLGVSSAPASASPWLHARVLSLCAFLIAGPLLFLRLLWQNYESGAWMLAVTAFSIEVVFKVVVTLLLYAVSLVDAAREGALGDIDDCLYYIRAGGNCVEFVFGVFLFFNGGYIFFFESGGIIRGVMMVIHAYFNIWLQAQEGLRNLKNRCLALSRMRSLPLATERLLADRGDVCAICYSDMAADCRVTPCSHVFHSACIRKWIAVSSDCPMCHSGLFGSTGRAHAD